ncbi:hypothetical protein E2557_05730 [Staphylococcus petrasii]|uniref:Nitrogen fixation protein NifR n=1 Tax=Staphylococcus petrasii TaxID=1276936 RepID=A0ABY2KXB2_9STAP|nr:hypothetical protein CD137_02040 [Staphylococcus petrasii]TGE12399.1 hypothetical protein E2557_05730 [Staphylococcus petrasii]TGE17904.1 hypothetical protein BJR09_05115 [Staphylococcus petrasii]
MRLNQAFFKPSHPCRGAGPQHRDFRKESLQTKQVGVGRRNYFNFCPAPFFTSINHFFLLK